MSINIQGDTPRWIAITVDRADGAASFDGWIEEAQESVWTLHRAPNELVTRIGRRLSWQKALYDALLLIDNILTSEA